jgi:hypothetical protein
MAVVLLYRWAGFGARFFEPGAGVRSTNGCPGSANLKR